MPISQAIADFAGALDAARDELAGVNAAIEALEVERSGIVRAQPHSDDIAAVFLRGLRATSQEFSRQLATRLADTYQGEDSAAAAGPTKAAQLLRLEAQKPDRDELVSRSMRGAVPDLNVAALTYFLQDKIAAEIPALVDKLCPAARQGMKRADREGALADIDARLQALKEDRDRLNADLGAARAAVIRS